MKQALALDGLTRWLPRFSLRTLLVLVTVLGVGLGYLGIVQRRVLRQRKVVKAIESVGGDVRYHHQVSPWGKLDYPGDWGVRYSFGKTADGRPMVTRTTAGVQDVFIETPPGPWILRRLLGDDAFADVYDADLGNLDGPARTDFDPELLVQLPQLEVVQLVGAQVNDEWLEAVARIPSLRGLVLSGNKEGPATAKGLRYLNAAKELRTLSLLGEWLRDDHFKAVGDLPGLTSLYLAHAPQVTGEIWADVGKLRELRSLSVAGAYKLDDSKSEHLRHLKRLREIQLHETAITDVTVSQLAALPELESAVLSCSGAGDAGVEAISKLAKLKVLDLTKSNVGDISAESISRLTELRFLRLGATRVTDDGLAAIGRMTSLESLTLWPLEVSDEGIMQLQSLSNLKELSVGPHISKEAADRLRAALPQCEIRRVDATGSSSWPD